MTRAPASSHERLVAEEPVRHASNRSFGLVAGAALTVLGLTPMLRGGPPRGWAVVVGASLLACGLLFPRVLGPLARAWLALGLALHAIVSPLIMALLYYVIVTPIGLLLRLFGKDLLRLRVDHDAPSYWIDRAPPGPAPDTMHRQF